MYKKTRPFYFILIVIVKDTITISIIISVDFDKKEGNVVPIRKRKKC